jgi:hypothetical protein
MFGQVLTQGHCLRVVLQGEHAGWQASPESLQRRLFEAGLS